MTNTPDHNEQFEQVLNRLDALMKRGQSADAPLPPAAPPPPEPQGYAELTVAEIPELAPDDSGTHFVILEEPPEIPVLTEVYDGASPESPADEGTVLAEAVIDALMPLMLENLDTIVEEEAARMKQNIADRLRAEIAATLRERLQPKP